MQPVSSVELPSPAAGSAPAASASGAFPLSAAQREVWFASQLSAAASLAYHESTALRLTGRLNIDAMRRALHLLVGRHEALRLRFNEAGTLQHVVPEGGIDLIIRSFAGQSALEAEAAARSCIDEHLHRPFDLVQGPLIRALVLETADDTHLLALIAHHVICDGWSLGLLTRELGELYSAAVAGRLTTLAKAPSFVAHATAATTPTEQARQAADEAFWARQFADGAPMLELPADRSRPVERSYRVEFVMHALPADLTARLKQLCGEQQCTPFMLMFGALSAFLHRITGQDDLVIGVPAAAQVMGGAEGLVGHFANLLPVRVAIAGRSAFLDHLAATKRTIGSAMEHWRHPFGELARQLHLTRDSSRMPLAPIVFQATARSAQLKFEGLAMQPETNEKRYGAFDLNINFFVQRDEFVIGTYANADVLDATTVRRWLEHFETLLHGIVAAPETPVAELPLLTAEQRNQILVTWNQTALPYRRDACIDLLFAEQAQRTPGATAIVSTAGRVTYAELQARAQRLAARLRAAGVGPDVPVGVFLERTPHLLTAKLGVLAAGGAYVPLDRSAPAERLAFIMNDTRMPVLLTQRSRLAQVPPSNVRAILVDDDASEAGETATTTAGPARHAENLAYIIYTSGSTGQPKGVGVPHRAVSALVAWAGSFYRREELAGVVYSTSSAFDVSVFESLVPLCLGGTLLLAEDLLQVPSLPYVREARLISGVPSAIAELVRAGSMPRSVTTVNVAGEPCPQSLVEALYALPHIQRVIDVYGPTETTVYSTGGVRERGGRATIGRPLPNEQAYILDGHGQPVPLGVRGELYLGGEKLARGYLNRPELTRERFIEAPFQPGLRLYRTGDAARYFPNGEIEYLGRLDDQVKIRGYRIEPGEVQAVLSRAAGVAEAVVLAQPEPAGNGRRLVGYVVAKPGATLSTAVLREHVLQQVPEYMCPSVFVVLDAFPRNTSGKIDRAALPNPAPAASAASERIGPRNTMEQLLADIWIEVLGVHDPSVHDNFFELGGHSLLAAQVIARLEHALGITVTYQEFFAAPTIATLATTVEAALVKDLEVMG